MPDLHAVEIERAHRTMSVNQNKYYRCQFFKIQRQGLYTTSARGFYGPCKAR